MVKKSKLTVMMFVLAATSTVCGYSQSDFMLISGKTMTADERQLEIFQEVKTCFEAKEVRVFQSKNDEVLWKWIEEEIERYNRHVTTHLNKETGVYVAMSLPKPNVKNEKKAMKSKEFQRANTALFDKVQTCLARENVFVIETKNVEILQMWLKEVEEGRNISTNFNAETGVYTAVSSPKTDGNGKAIFRKID